MIHFIGLFLFLFIPFVLYLFLQHPFGVPQSFAIAIGIMIVHRFIARPFFLRNAEKRCFWCGQTRHPRESWTVNSYSIQTCANHTNDTQRFFDFTYLYRTELRIGIFIPLVWFIVAMLFFRFPESWNRFIFQFFIALTVVIISFAYRSGHVNEESQFPFPIHNLFLIGAKNTLLVFRYVGLWWLATSLYFLWKV